MIPFKKKDEVPISQEVDASISRDPDEPEEYGMLDAIAEDFIEAMEKKDRRRMVMALAAYCDYVMGEIDIQVGE